MIPRLVGGGKGFGVPLIGRRQCPRNRLPRSVTETRGKVGRTARLSNRYRRETGQARDVDRERAGCPEGDPLAAMARRRLEEAR